jgi:phosphoadenosine phosphosulfate reductase
MMSMVMFTDQDLSKLNADFSAAQPEEILRWAVETFEFDIAASSSFQTQGVPLLYMISIICPNLPIIFLDTRYHSPETLAFRDRLVQDWNLNVRVVQAAMTQEEFTQQYGTELYRDDPDQCCYINKVEPMQRALVGLRAWISGIRRDQSSARSNVRPIERTPQGIIRVHPLANWSKREVWQYFDAHHLPQHPLSAQGFPSIGCAPCTWALSAEDARVDERNGRWVNNGKIECGLHTLLRESASDLRPKSAGSLPSNT